jgi:hypothetical protein
MGVGLRESLPAVNNNDALFHEKARKSTAFFLHAQIFLKKINKIHRIFQVWHFHKSMP